MQGLHVVLLPQPYYFAHPFAQPMQEIQDDPFVDIESQLIGETDVWLNALANMVEFSAETSILSVFGQVPLPLLA